MGRDSSETRVVKIEKCRRQTCRKGGKTKKPGTKRKMAQGGAIEKRILSAPGA